MTILIWVLGILIALEVLAFLLLAFVWLKVNAFEEQVKLAQREFPKVMKRVRSSVRSANSVYGIVEALPKPSLPLMFKVAKWVALSGILTRVSMAKR